MSSLLELIRNSLPEAIGGLAVAAILTILGLLYKRLSRKNITPQKTSPTDYKSLQTSIEKIRVAHGVRPLLPLESNKKTEQLPAGVYGYITPWTLNGAPDISLKLQRSKGGTSVVEIHKSMSGVLFVIGFIAQSSLIQLEDPSRTDPIDMHIFFDLYEEYIHPVAIPLNRIIHADNRTIEGVDECDMRIG
jgi:hypothetical protein